MTVQLVLPQPIFEELLSGLLSLVASPSWHVRRRVLSYIQVWKGPFFALVCIYMLSLDDIVMKDFVFPYMGFSRESTGVHVQKLLSCPK